MKSAPRSTATDPTVAQLGFRILLASLSMIFASTLVAYAAVRLDNAVWHTPEMPGLPPGLIATTAILVGISALLEASLRRARRNHLLEARHVLHLVAILGLVFLVGQGLCWRQMLGLPATAPRTLYPFTFVMLTGTHAAHVLGGLVSIGVVEWRLAQGAYSSSHHEGLRLVAQYWHYLSVVWFIILGALWMGT